MEEVPPGHGAGEPTLLSPDDARILALESDAVLGHTLKLLILAPGPTLDVEGVRERLRARLPHFPRALDRVEQTAAGPAWVPAPTIDMDAHVRARPAATPADLRLAVSELMSERLDRRRPLWTLDILGPLDGGRQALAVRIHHAMADGMSGVRFLDSTVLEPHDAPLHPVGTHAAAPPLSRWAEWERMPGALLREFGRPGSHSPWDRPITGRRALAFTDLPLERMRAIGGSRAHHATVNDVLLAVIAGGIRRWLLQHPDASAHVPRMRAQIPVSLHTAGEGAAAGGNRDSFLNVDLLLHEHDDLRRLDGISAQTRRRKADHDATLMDDLFRELSRAGSLGTRLRQLAEGPREFGLAVSNVPGPRVAVAVHGRPVERLYSSSEPAPHHALRISAISTADTLGVVFCVDPAAIPDVTGLADAAHETYEVLAAAAPGA
ncbi:wax ester/triacylglycerol synthase domain-containing protein [Microbacterium sp. RD1]|uniref:wax ester/triacylglycerol synthase domain-containing protein n=1 Tax=Microbacterium sp. RD1 TaxID=3457313 RepID=UPI003FA5CE3F